MEFPSVLRIAVITIRHLIEVNETQNGELIFSGGVQAKFIQTLSFALGFTYKIVIPKDNEWGRIDQKGDWTGMIGMVHRNEADIAIGHITITPKRYEAVDFLPFSIEQNTFVTKLPGTLPKVGSYLQPFQYHVWIICIVTLFSMPFIFRILMKKKYSILKLLLVMFGCFVNQSIPQTINKDISWFLSGSWFIFAFVLSSSYNAVLLSSLTVPLHETGVHNIKDLSSAVADGNFKVFASKGSADKELLSESKDKFIKIIGENIIEKEWISDSKMVVAPSDIEENTAIIGPKFFYLLEYGEEPFTNKLIFKESIGTFNVGIAIRKDFCCKKQFLKTISKIIDSGIYLRFYEEEQSLRRKMFKLEKRPSLYGALKLTDLLGAFILLPAGYGLAIISCMIEMFVHTRKASKKRQKRFQSWVYIEKKIQISKVQKLELII